jgi:hypothetical protein
LPDGSPVNSNNPTPAGVTKELLFFSRKGSLMNRRVSQNVGYVNFIFAELCVKLCETLRETELYNFLVSPNGRSHNKHFSS